MASPAKILIVEDELDLAELIAYHFKKKGYEVTEAHDGQAGLDATQSENFDLIILDLMMPKLTGMEVFHALRSENRTRDIPVIMLTAKGQPSDRIAGLEAGADDYLTKPFIPKELVLRGEKLLQNATKVRQGHILTIDNLAFDKVNLTFTVNGETTDLTSTEFKLLLYLCERRDQIQSRATLLEEVWGYSGGANSRTLDTHMKRIRQKIEGASESIKTIRGQGYMYASTK